MSLAGENPSLDDVDRGILQLLQRDARNKTAVEIGETIGVSDGTVRNRIEKLEGEDIIEGYVPLINYERAGFPLEMRIVCTARIGDRAQLAEEALQIKGVVEIVELMTGRGNVEVTAVAPTHDELTSVAKGLDELGLEVEREELISRHFFRPFNHFGVRDVSGGEDVVHEV